MESGEWAKGEPGESYLRKESTILSAALSVIEITEDCSGTLVRTALPRSLLK